MFLLWLVSGLILIFRAWQMWAQTVFLITDRRVIDVEQKGFFHRVVTEARYDQLDEVSYRVKGIFPTLFHYGTIKLQLSGSAADILVMHVKRPDRLTNLLNDLRSETRSPSHAVT